MHLIQVGHGELAEPIRMLLVSPRATVVRSDTVWFKDDNALTYTMCEDR